MPDENNRKEAAALARLSESWLTLGAKLDTFGMALTTLALAILFLKGTTFPVLAGLVCAVVLGILGKYLALRVALDRRLFLLWAVRWESSATGDPDEDIASLDAALVTSGLRIPSPGPLRSLQDRQRGAFGLFRNQAFVFLLQCAILLASAVAAQWGQ